MRTIENECVGCPPELGCMGSACRYQNVPHYYCDFCKDQDVKLYDYNGYEICGDCLIGEFEIVEGTEDF